MARRTMLGSFLPRKMPLSGRLTEPVTDEPGRHMALLCPICKSPAQELARTGDATGFHCPTHGDFKVADTIDVDDYYTRAEWETALLTAKHKAMKGEWPVIRRGDFFR